MEMAWLNHCPDNKSRRCLALAQPAMTSLREYGFVAYVVSQATRTPAPIQTHLLISWKLTTALIPIFLWKGLSSQWDFAAVFAYRQGILAPCAGQALWHQPLVPMPGFAFAFPEIVTVKVKIRVLPQKLPRPEMTGFLRGIETVQGGLSLAKLDDIS